MNMNSTNFIKGQLSIIAANFPHILIKYGFDASIETHIVELLPFSEYYDNSRLSDEWVPVSLKFMKLFPNENIAFISSDSTLTIDDVLFEANYNIHAEEDLT